MIYLEPELQQKLIPLFHYSLNPDGILVFGTSESIGRSKDLFVPFPGKTRIFRRQKNNLNMGLIDFPAAFVQSRPLLTAESSSRQPQSTSPDLQALTDGLVSRRFSPAAVLATHLGDIVYSSSKTGKYLEPTVGRANLNIFAMAREGLARPLTKAVREQTTITLKGVEIEAHDKTLFVDIVVQHLSEPAEIRGMVLIVFLDVPDQASTKTRKKSRRGSGTNVPLEELAKELQRSKEEAQAIREEMQTSQEELKSANEELQSTNEELQSTNEELTTFREKMQSMNEELQTVNQELTAKVDQLSQASDDMKNLLNSTEIATLFLDDQLKVRRFTTKTVNIFNLIPSDAGRPITDLVSVLDYPDLTKDVRAVRKSLDVCERQIPTHDGRWFSVRIMPYRTQDENIDGVVITFIDISGPKTLEATLLKALSVIQKQTANQTDEQDSHEELTEVLEQVKNILEKQFSGHNAESLHVHTEMQTQEGKSDEAG